MATEEAAGAALDKAGARRWVSFEVNEVIEESFRQERRGRPGADTRYRKHTTTRFELPWKVRDEAVAFDTATDGCFPLITNDVVLSPAEVLAAYKYQPTSSADTPSSRATNSWPRCSSRIPLASRACCAATSSPWWPRPSSSDRSVQR